MEPRRITAEEVNKMVLEATLGRATTSIPGEEAAVLYEQIKEEVREIKAKGGMPWPLDV